jgi:hypothetical protein
MASAHLELPQDHAIEGLCLYFPRRFVSRGDSDRLRALIDRDDFLGGNECGNERSRFVGHASNLPGRMRKSYCHDPC